MRRTPAGRYGTRRPPRAFYAVGGGLLLGLIVVILMVGRHIGTPGITFGVRAFTTSDRAVRITFEVEKRPGATAVCDVRARGRDGAEVGRRELPVGPRRDGARRTILTTSLPTSERPVTGEVTGCRLTG